MATEMTMPQLGESVTEGTISKWLVEPGQSVKKYEPIAEVLTDKVNAEIPSSYSGTIQELLVSEDETVEVGRVICVIEVDEAVAKREPSESKSSEVPNDTASVDRIEDTKSQKRRYSPAVLRLASEHQIDLESVTGSGKGGRITRKDIQTVIDNGGVQTETPVSEKKTVKPRLGTTQQQVVTTSGDVEVPLSSTRKAIAANMVHSKQDAPHAWMMVEADVTNLVSYRNQIKGEFKQKEGFNLTFLPFFIKAVVEALKEFPGVNAVWGGDKIIQKKDINISIAVATDDALYVPVIKNADEKSIKAIGREVNELANKVRTGSISSDNMRGGTFTVNNTGSFGSILSTPILNHPQAAILSVESIVKRPVVIESDAGDMIAIRSMVNLCLSLDHRVLDGLICGRFLARVKEILENTSKENTSVY
ncbi:dihydrolipoamide acetyltransferase family protein [Halalkalibacter hemicellulosilyticus]|uniref:Dihydrolipoamide acetyltransferase component of pyruvate dehydrogenase complex n=1 Tax=Halalkalibacter hemicellulosilyticusJCM 9152 TaxID=1236971 RepID=W4QJW2_9BACI|nr:dihydrolipoamide acetyltransferase family protein [Halalkalibacter hemicellulosilyticus]GAE31903.1 dihydrolipoamide acyltransferase component of branched-chain alpha-keto acid dehydrogenase complex [Halalkalibacter hemicellulosilyticusJCM 9152]